MKKKYNIIPAGKFSIAIKENSFDRLIKLTNLVLKKSDFSSAIWNYQENSSNKKGFLLHLDSFFNKKTIEFSNQGMLFIKTIGSKNFALFTNHKIEKVNLTEEEPLSLDLKALKLLPSKILPGIFTYMYKKKKKYIFCLDLEICFKAYKQLLKN